MTITAQPSRTGAARAARRGDARALARRLAPHALAAGVLGGLVMIGIMTLVMGGSGMGYATPLNLGMASFAFIVAPPLAMLPSLVSLMGISLPPAVMSQLAAAVHAGHVPAAMVRQLGSMLTAMRVPASTAAAMGQLMSGHATNAGVASLIGRLSPAAQHSVMAAMPVSASHSAVGLLVHLGFSALLGLVFFSLIAAAAWLGLPGLRSPAGIVAAVVVGGAVVYALTRLALPSVNPMMGLVPPTAFFIAHLVFGLVVGSALAMNLRRPALCALLPA
jgi:hypothetical protein